MSNKNKETKKPLWKVFDCIQCGEEVRNDKGVTPDKAYCGECVPIVTTILKKPVRQWALIANKTREKTNGEMFGYERKPSNAKDREPSGLTIRIRIYSNGYSYKLKETLHGIHEMTSEHLFKGSNKHVSLNDKIRRSGFKFTDGELVVLPYEHEISAIMKASSEDLREALVKAAQEAFQNEIIDTDSMSEICQGSQFESREEWEEIKIEEWLGA